MVFRLELNEDPLEAVLVRDVVEVVVDVMPSLVVVLDTVDVEVPSPETLSPETLSPETLSPETLSPETL
jgi:hypothetical protein